MGDNYRVPAFIIIQSVTIVLIWSTSCLLCMSSYVEYHVCDRAIQVHVYVECTLYFMFCRAHPWYTVAYFWRVILLACHVEHTNNGNTTEIN